MINYHNIVRFATVILLQQSVIFNKRSLFTVVDYIVMDYSPILFRIVFRGRPDERRFVALIQYTQYSTVYITVYSVQYSLYYSIFTTVQYILQYIQHALCAVGLLSVTHTHSERDGILGEEQSLSRHKSPFVCPSIRPSILSIRPRSNLRSSCHCLLRYTPGPLT